MAINSLRPRQNGRHFTDDIFKGNFLNVNVWIPIKISLRFVPKGPINNIPALIQIMAWRRPGDKPLSEAMMVSLPTHICLTRLQWVKQTMFSRGWEVAEPLVSLLLPGSFSQGDTALCAWLSLLTSLILIFPIVLQGGQMMAPANTSGSI